MFSHIYDEKLGILTTRPNETIGIDWLLHLIENNPFKSVIERLRRHNKGTAEYTRIKRTLPFSTLNAIIGNHKCNDDIARMSGYIYFDIDSIHITDVYAFKNWLIAKFRVTVCFISVGGKGVGFLLK